MTRRILRRIWICLAVIAVLILYIIWGNTSIAVTQITVTASKLPAEFSGFRIAHVSDLHNTQFGENNETLLRLLARSQPDIIVLTGDLIDSRHTNVDVSIRFAEQAAQIAPTYYVTGNHEARVPDAYDIFRSAIIDAGVHVLENALIPLERGGAAISLLGLHDRDPILVSVSENLPRLADQAQGYTILLAHRPELIHYYAREDIDLVFCGHAHGGQFRLPFIGGLVAPGQGLLPEYDAGLYQLETTQMIVSRGLGNSSFPFRLNNRPELVLAVLESGA